MTAILSIVLLLSLTHVITFVLDVVTLQSQARYLELGVWTRPKQQRRSIKVRTTSSRRAVPCQVFGVHREWVAHGPSRYWYQKAVLTGPLSILYFVFCMFACVLLVFSYVTLGTCHFVIEGPWLVDSRFWVRVPQSITLYKYIYFSEVPTFDFLRYIKRKQKDWKVYKKKVRFL